MELEADTWNVKVMKNRETDKWMVIPPDCVHDNIHCIELSGIAWPTFKSAIKDATYLANTIETHTAGRCNGCN